MPEVFILLATVGSETEIPVLRSPRPLSVCREPGQWVSHGTGMRRKEWALRKFSCRLPAVCPLFCSNLHQSCCYNPDLFLIFCQSFQLLKRLRYWRVSRNRNQGLNFCLKLSEKVKKKKGGGCQNKKLFMQWTVQVNWTAFAKSPGKQTKARNSLTQHYCSQASWAFSWLGCSGCLQLRVVAQVVGTYFVRHRWLS